MEVTSKTEFIIDEARSLFFSQGIKRVTTEKICSQCGISKRTFYKVFKNKYQVAQRVLEIHLDREYNFFLEIRKGDLSFKEKILAITNHELEACENVEYIFFKDVLENCTELQEFIRDRTRDSQRYYYEFILDEQAKGNIRSDISPSYITHLLINTSSQLIFDPVVEKAYPNFKKRTQTVVETLLSGFL